MKEKVCWDSLQTQKFQSSPKSFWMGWVGGGREDEGESLKFT